MQTTEPRCALGIHSVPNLRDLGGLTRHDGSQTRFGRVYRSENLIDLSDEEVSAAQAAGLKTIIDLRRDEEIANKPNMLGSADWIRFHNVSLFPQLDPAEYSRNPDLLEQIYLRSITEAGQKFARILEIIADAPEGGILYHCTIGKDRTGLITAILLELSGVRREDILVDYELTTEKIASRTAIYLKAAEQRGINPEHYHRALVCDRRLMELFFTTIETRHGRLETWLRSIGLSDARIARLKALL